MNNESNWNNSNFFDNTREKKNLNENSNLEVIEEEKEEEKGDSNIKLQRIKKEANSDVEDYHRFVRRMSFGEDLQNLLNPIQLILILST